MHLVTGICDGGHTKMAENPRPVGYLPQFWKIPEMVRVIRITALRDLKQARRDEPKPA